VWAALHVAVGTGNVDGVMTSLKQSIEAGEANGAWMEFEDT
jgi:hypothetical protein